MDCKICNGKMIKISDLTLEEIEVFFNNNPLKPLGKLEKNDAILVYFREVCPIFKDEIYNNKIQFRKVEKLEKNQLKLFGFKNLFPLNNPTVLYGNNLLYTLVPMEEKYLEILKNEVKKLGKNYSGTKLNNILKKSFMLEEFKIQYDRDILPKLMSCEI